MKTILFACLALIVLTQKTAPVWPNQFEQDFIEEENYSFLHLKNSGKIFYDYTNMRYRVDRDNGKGDRYCGSVYKLTDTPCSHIVVEGKRYLYFPKKNDCCYCCDAAHGCGLLRPDWAADAEFIDVLTNKDGLEVEQWNKKGLQNNFYYQTRDTKIMTEIDQQPNDTQFFDPFSLYLGIRDRKVLDLPPQCNASKTCPWLSVCTPLRD